MQQLLESRQRKEANDRINRFVVNNYLRILLQRKRNFSIALLSAG